MLDRSKICAVADPILREHGLRVFEVELPVGGSSRVIRLFLCKEDGQCSGILLDQCTAASRALSNDETFEALLPENCVLEVSSPGVNRKLTRVEHYRGAIGERVRVTVDSAQVCLDSFIDLKKSDDDDSEDGAPKRGRPARMTVCGELQSVTDRSLKLVVEGKSGAELEIPFTAVHRARVDFIFTER